MSSFARFAFCASLCALPLSAFGCADPPEPAAPRVAIKKPTKASRKALRIGKPQVAEKRSEHEAVLDEDPDPEAQKLFEARLAEPALTFTTSASPPRVTAIALSDTARGEAPGMKGAEPIAEARLKEGQRAMMQVTIAKGACATFIAQGGLGVVEVDLFLVLADRSNGARVLAQDNGVGPIATVGGHGRCYKNSLDTKVEAELHATVRRGAGVVLVTGYRSGAR